jgi:2-oxoglutarate dehydrogenase E2 component (dihydrolipoamide succinyltransferase)
MGGGTFTISVFGSLLGTPIINPQSTILGMHGIFERPIAIKGQVSCIFFTFLLYLRATVCKN